VSLGEVVTDVEAARAEPRPPADHPHADPCADCGRCLRHCPTKAITAPYVVDQSRCISHLTQMGGAIPVELRPLLGARVYGCDVCQEVCPLNAGVRASTPEFAESRFPGAFPELIPLIELTAPEFAKSVRDSSIGWIRRKRIRRNAAVAAGNLKCEAAIPALKTMIGGGDPLLAEHAKWALERIR
jgi:epoxyqueuosine reductase